MDRVLGPELLCLAMAVAGRDDAQRLRPRRRHRRGPGDGLGGCEGFEQRVRVALAQPVTICLVTDRRQLSPHARTAREEVTALAHWLEEAVAAGVDLIHLRERDLPASLLCELARAVGAAARGSNTRVVVNDRADVAQAAGCDGVHLPGDGLPVARVRALGGRPDATWMVGRSVHTVEEARAHADADYLLFGAVFASGPKPGRGVDALREVVAAVPGAVIAIGGLTAPRAAECLTAGAAGVAAIRLFLPPGRAADAVGITTAVSQLRLAFDAAATGHLE